MNTPDTSTETDELLDDVEASLEEIVRYGYNAGEAFNLIAPTIAAIRRQAAADALKTQATHLDGRARFWRNIQTSHETKGRPESADPYRHYADQAHRTADYLRKEAAGIIAEGYPFECAAFGQECDQRVPNAGDFCPACEPEDDEDRWSE